MQHIFLKTFFKKKGYTAVMKNTYTLNIGGTSFSIVSDESEEYIRYLEENVGKMIDSALMRGASSYKAALFVCMELFDMYEKEKKKETSDAGQKKQKKNCEQVLFPEKGQTSLF